MRIGAPVFCKPITPENWIAELKRKGYRAAFSPVKLDATPSQRDEYALAAREGDIIIAEVGAWSNPLSPDSDEAQKAFRKCVESLRLADDIGAVCCVNIAGNMGPGPWDGPCAENLTQIGFEKVVSSVQQIIDEAAPEHASYCLETMPWMYPHSADSYLDLIKAIDRSRFGVHFDPVNLINSPELHLMSGPFLEDCISKLAKGMLSVHAKDQTISSRLTLHLDEAAPGRGGIDYDAFLGGLSKLDPDLPVMIEHLSSEEEYDAAFDFISNKLDAFGIAI